LVVKAFEMIADGVTGTTRVRQWLADQGVSIGKNGLYRMLQNKIYLGIIEAFGLQERGAPPMVPLLSESLFYRAQVSLRPHNGPGTINRNNDEFPLRGTVLCPCGQALTASWSRGRTQRYPYYRCRTCSRVNVRRDAVEDAFVGELQGLNEALGLHDAGLQSLKSDWEASRADNSLARERLKTEETRIKALQRALVLKVVEGIVPDHLASEQIRDFEKRLSVIVAKLGPGADETGEPSIDAVLTFAKTFLSQVGSIWQGASIESKKRIQNTLFPGGFVLRLPSHPRTGSFFM
jgi:hypothetical protein